MGHEPTQESKRQARLAAITSPTNQINWMRPCDNGLERNNSSRVTATDMVHFQLWKVLVASKLGCWCLTYLVIPVSGCSYIPLPPVVFIKLCSNGKFCHSRIVGWKHPFSVLYTRYIEKKRRQNRIPFLDVGNSTFITCAFTKDGRWLQELW